LTWQAPDGFFIGAATSWNVHMSDRMAAGFPDTSKDDKGFEVRIGIHPGVHDRAGTVYVAPPPPPAPPAPPARPAQAAGPGQEGPGQTENGNTRPAVANRPPTVRASCDPCTVEVGRTATVTADAQDPDGDPLTYQWTTQAGTLANPTSRQSLWTAPMQVGPVPFTVVVNDGKGGTARDTVTIQVIQPAARQYTFEDVHFEFDRFTLRPDALHVLDGAVTAMQADATLRLTIEGYTCNIGTAEYNLALGERRAQAVRNYLVSRGISADRLRTVSYGEERAKYDNSREETRRLNRRAALVVRLE
jgi:outer membrane protein OmpA-like peptidoglycan-associated protein